MNIKETFLKLTSFTSPYGTEETVIERFPFEIEDLQKDKFGNYFVEIGENSRTLFTSHLDTASSSFVEVKHIIKENIITSDGTSILGADDRAGITIMLYMIENKVPGLYYFFLGEERGCIGSSAASKYYDWSNYDRCISFDRRNYGSIITNQMGQSCCSDLFATTLAKMYTDLGVPSRPDPTGIFTDSASFIGIIKECTNISVGYRGEHGTTEQQDIDYLQLLAEKSILIDWESLPIEGPSKTHRGYHGYHEDYWM